MPHIITYNLETHTIESKIEGDLTFDEVKEIIVEFAHIVKKKGCTLLLNDFGEATIKLSTIEIYQLPQIMLNTFASLGLEVRQLRRALVVSKEVEDFQFHESVMTNRGQRVKVFFDIDEAKKWLYKK